MAGDHARIAFHRPSIGGAEIRAVTAVLRSGWLTSGPEVERFEAEFAAAVGARHAVAVNSGTAALHLALAALGITAGDDVVVPTMSFAADAEVVLRLGARPVFADCDPRSLNLTPAAAAAALTPRTRAIIAVHYAGLPCPVTELRALARRHALALVEDAAHAFPARAGREWIGAGGAAVAFSFYASKNLTCGEGGMVTTPSARLAARMRRLRLHGLSASAWERRGQGPGYDIREPGYKYNLSDLAAALGRVQLARAARLHAARERLARRYHRALAAIPEIELPPWIPAPSHAWHLYVIQLRLERLRGGRDAFLAALRRRGIEASVHYKPLHLHSFYRRVCGCRPADFPYALAAYRRIISLPFYAGMPRRGADQVIAALRDTCQELRR
ncbi:MAG: DegT/DnrJ/EryC1/StrS family aminotransferase [Terriglobales bacterium]